MNDGSMLTNETRLAEAVNEALQQDKITAPFTINAAAQGSTISLTGEVDSDQAKQRAEQIARGVSGVIDVTNELVVRSGAGKGLLGDILDNRADSTDAPGLGAVPFAAAAGAGGAGTAQAGPTFGAAGAAGAAAFIATEGDRADDADNASSDDRNR